MKKILALSSVAILAAAVVGCGGKKTSSSPSALTPPPPAPAPDVRMAQAPSAPTTPVSYTPAPPLSDNSAAAAAGPASGKKYTVQKGDTLWSLATKTYGDGKQYKKIVAANPSIKGDQLKAGQTIVIP